MNTRFVLSRGDVEAMLHSVMEYNNKTPIGVAFLGPDGSPVDVNTIEVTCEEPGLKVRIAPEGTTQMDYVRSFRLVQGAR